jgi:hypothetical protein
MMKPDLVPQALWDVIPEDRREALLLECGRRFRTGMDREAAFVEACDRVLADEVWEFLGLEDFVEPVSWPLLVERDLTLRHPTFLRALELYGTALTSPHLILHIRDRLEDVFYLSDYRPKDGDCPYCGMALRETGEVSLGDETVHKMCADDYERTRLAVAERLVDYCRNHVPEDQWDPVEEEEEEVVEVEPLPEFLSVFDDDGDDAA